MTDDYGYTGEWPPQAVEMVPDDEEFDGLEDEVELDDSDDDEMCYHCDGTGVKGRRICPRCEGSGRLDL